MMILLSYLKKSIPLPSLYPFLHLRFYPAVLTPQAAEPAG